MTRWRGSLAVLCAAVAGCLLGACAPSTRVILLPQDSGKPSAVQVQSAYTVQWLDQPYQRADVGLGGRVSVTQDTADAVARRYAPLTALRPEPAQRFTLYFLPGGAALTPESLDLLEPILGAAQARAGGEILVIGHTDRTGTQAGNDALSLQRAQAIRDLMLQRGFPPERVVASGRGERQPLVPTDAQVSEPRNRRVEILVR